MANVLPLENQKKIQRAQRTRFLFVFALTALACALMFSVALVPSYLALHAGNVTIGAGSAAVASSTAALSTVKATKNVIMQLNAAMRATSTPSQVFTAILSEKPAGITINTLLYESGGAGKAVVSARATGSEVIQTYQSALEKDTRFRSVAVPVNALVGSSNGDFTITLTGSF